MLGTILSTISRAVITQTFINPSSKAPLPEVLYTFPRYDGASIVSFTCHVGDEVIVGKVKLKNEADKLYREVKAKGKTAAIVDQSVFSDDVFKTRVGNVPAGGRVIVKITLLQELPQDTKRNGPRYTAPMAIALRYGISKDEPEKPEGLTFKSSIKVDVIMDKNCKIRQAQPPTHAIEVSLGRTSEMPDSIFEPFYASAKMNEDRVIGEDFVLVVNADSQDQPIALWETHPTIPNQSALIVSLVPKCRLPLDPSETVFVIDRSGSMADKIPTLKSALEVSLKSMPLGIPFNIVSFGSSSSTLWPRSRMSDRNSLSGALEFTKTIKTDMGGTKVLQALQTALEHRYKDRCPKILLLTDGQVWEQAEIFTQSVVKYEELSKKVVQMLKGALTPLPKKCRLDLDIDSLQQEEMMTDMKQDKLGAQLSSTLSLDPISFFDGNISASESLKLTEEPLPKISVPAVLQAPAQLPPLYPFIRSTAFVLISSPIFSLPEKTFLRATSYHGPLELEIPVLSFGCGEQILQLAAKKAITELEQSCGWIQSARNEHGELIRDKFESHMDELIQEECGRLGVLFQIPGKLCSVVAVRGKKETSSLTQNEDISPPTSEGTEVFLNLDWIDAKDTFSHPYHSSESSGPDESDEDYGFFIPDKAPQTRSSSSAAPGPYRPRIYSAGEKRRGAAPPRPACKALRRITMSDDDADLSVAALEAVQSIIQEQTFGGYWEFCEEVVELLGQNACKFCDKIHQVYEALTGQQTNIIDRSDWKEILTTSLVTHYLETKAGQYRGVWELLKEKADRWVEEAVAAMRPEDRDVARKLIEACHEMI
ncbi:hypothetical protein POX_b02480 [Penicillium oxalicum]|uniref:hypothetical protein n=1 Tax=Penicillium oxalicum TaxID=69781 RepID=UPI0020B6C8A9|nr:hypothetical protein POX_b02480 [Penicillium oxalicum]KAI2792442.1 hypothetical protein POX_b02480 [Penicillium oxalicum]